MNDIFECVEKLTLIMQGNLEIGDHEALSAFGNREQQQLAELSKDISQLYINGRNDIEIVINELIDKMNMLGKESYQNRFWGLKWGNMPKSVIYGRYNEIVQCIEILSNELELQRIKLLKEIHLLSHLENQLQACEADLQVCFEKGNNVLSQKQEEDTNSEWWLRLEQRLGDISVTKIIAAQSLMQVRLLYENNKEIINRIDTLIKHIVPIWKKQVEILLSVTKKEEEIRICQMMEDEIKLLSASEMADVTIRKELERITSEKEH